jgi:hypothetical protein
MKLWKYNIGYSQEELKTKHDPLIEIKNYLKKFLDCRSKDMENLIEDIINLRPADNTLT